MKQKSTRECPVNEQQNRRELTGLERRQVRRDLEDAGYSLADIGRELKITRQTVCKAVRRPAESARVCARIIEILQRNPWAKSRAAA